MPGHHESDFNYIRGYSEELCESLKYLFDMFFEKRILPEINVIVGNDLKWFEIF